MKSAFIISAVLSSALGSAGDPVDPFLTWKPPGHGDVRDPCPGLNTLANYGLLPHDGKNINLRTITAAFAAFNGDADFANRDDAYCGDDHTFDQKTYNQSKSYWTSENVTVQMAANARAARIATSIATNPTFSQTFITHLGFGEPAAYFMVLGDHVTDGNQTTYRVKRSFVEYRFEKERFPVNLGWKPSTTPLNKAEFVEVMELIAKASPGNPQDLSSMKRRELSSHGF